jgi:3-dehydroquinate synthase
VARVTVELPGRRHPVLIGRGALQELPELVGGLGASGVALVTDSHVAPLWGDAVTEGLSGVGIPCPTLVVDAGERAKTLSVLEAVLAFLEDSRIDRRGVVIALGGGTVGDLAGFAAAVWLRGVRVLQVPTTLLAMVDSSIGGKTGINAPSTKNGIGAFWQPAAVVGELAALDTLPDGELLSGFAEVVKYGLSMDAGLAERLRADRDRLLARDPVALEAVVTRCVELKAAVVAADEREGAGRQILNYGHTTGHAIEAASGYTAVHGRAVAQGMRVAARLGVASRLCEPDVVEVHEDLLARFGLPGPLPRVTPDQVLAALPRDKKATGGRIGWVLPRRVGRAQVGVEVPGDTVARVVREVLAT